MTARLVAAARRSRLATPGLLGLLAAVSFAPDPWTAIPRLTYFFRDLSVTFYPVRVFAARELREGRLPVWNPFIFEGSFTVPYFYVLDLLHAFWPDPVAFSFLLSLQFPIAGLSAYALVRELGANRAGAFVGGAVYSLGGLCRSSANLYVFLQVLALAPLVALTFLRAARRGGRWVPLAGLAMALGLTTLAVEFVGQAVLLAVMLALAFQPSRAAAGRLALACALGVGLSGLSVVPLLGLLPETVRGAGLTNDVSLGHATPPLALLQVIVPDLFGPLADPVQIFWGHRFFPRLPYFLSLYLGPLVLALAYAGLPELPRRARIVLLGLAALGVWFALGEAGGLAPRLLPLLRVVRYPSKAHLVAFIAASVLAGLGAGALVSGRSWTRFCRACLLLSSVAALPLGMLIVAPDRVQQLAEIPSTIFRAVRATLILETTAAVALALLGVGLVYAVRRRVMSARASGLMVAAVVVIDLVRAHAGMNPQVDPSFFRLVPELAAERLDEPDAGRVFSYPLESSRAFGRFLAARPPNLRLVSFFVNRQLLAPYLNVIDRVRAPDDKDLTSFTPRPPELRPEDYQPDRFGRIAGWLRQSAVSRVLSLDRLDHPELRLTKSVPMGPPGLSIQVYALERPAPFVYLGCHVWRARSRDEAMSLPLLARFDLARDVALEVEGTAGCSSGDVEVASSLPAERRYRVRSDGGGYLVERENFALGWRAHVDGRLTPVQRANGKHRAVAVPAGTHEVVLRYHAPGLAAGLLLSGLSGAFVASLLLWPRVRRATEHEASARTLVPPLRIQCPRCDEPLADGNADGYACTRCGARYPVADGIVDLTKGGDRAGLPGYDPHYFTTLPRVEPVHFWFVHRRETILAMLRQHVPDLPERPLFDVGCGSGELLAFLRHSGLRLAGACDAYREGLILARRRVEVPLLLVDPEGPPPLAPGQAALAFFDVIEHLDDDERTLRWAFSTLAPGGALVITVPAHPFLFDEMDELAGHRRRYRRRDLLAKLRAAGFEVRAVRYFMAQLVPLLLLVRALGRLLRGGLSEPRVRRDGELRVVPVLNALLLLSLRIEGLLMRWLPLPFGSSLVAVAIRPASKTA